MSRRGNHLSLVIDEVLTEATAATNRRMGEAQAIKVAEALPRTEMARDLRTLAATMRSASDDVSYADLAGAL